MIRIGEQYRLGNTNLVVDVVFVTWDRVFVSCENGEPKALLPENITSNYAYVGVNPALIPDGQEITYRLVGDGLALRGRKLGLDGNKVLVRNIGNGQMDWVDKSQVGGYYE